MIRILDFTVKPHLLMIWVVVILTWSIGCSSNREPELEQKNVTGAGNNSNGERRNSDNHNSTSDAIEFNGAQTDSSFRLPNIILINLDDADCELFEHPEISKLFPNFDRLAKRGVYFSNVHVTTPLCGPSRAAFYRSQYAHNTGIRANDSLELNGNGFQGGFKPYRLQGFFDDDLSTWMKSAGYRTMMVGKYVHGIWEPFVPPGWDDFCSFQGAKYYGTFIFTNRTSTKGIGEHLPAEEYRTTAECREAMELLTKHLDESTSQSFFLNLNTFAPHQQSDDKSMIDVTMEDWNPDLKFPESPAFNEADVSDKPSYFQQIPPMSLSRQQFLSNHFRERVIATRSADELLGKIVNLLEERNLIDETFLFVTSDNGFSIGHHRSLGKGTSMDRATRVPLFVAGPQIPHDQVCNHLLGHIDLAPTLLRLAGQSAPTFIDGRSFAKLLFNPQLGEMVRSELLIENWQSKNEMNKTINAASSALRMTNSIYTEWANGDRDYYDLNSDPDQLENTYKNLPESQKAKLAARLRVQKSSQTTPLVTLTRPFASSKTISSIDSLSGMADDGRGVDNIKLVIYQESSNRYWNGNEWQADFVAVDAELENPQGLITIWNYASLPKSDVDPNEEITCTATAYNLDSVGSEPVKGNFMLAKEDLD